MTKFDYETFISETKIAAYNAKAIADAYAHEYVDGDSHITALMIESSPEAHAYLFTAMHDVLCEVCKRLEQLEDTEIPAAREAV